MARQRKGNKRERKGFGSVDGVHLPGHAQITLLHFTPFLAAIAVSLQGDERREDRGRRKKRRKEGEAGKKARARASERASESELRGREKESEQETVREKREREADRVKKRQREETGEKHTQRERVIVRVRERKENHEADAASRDSAISAVSLSGGEWLAL